MTSVRPLTAAILLAMTLGACGGSSDDDSDTPAPVTPPANTGFDYDATEMIASLTDTVIVAGYANLEQGMTDLHLAADNLRNDPTAENLLAAQNAWKAARQPWERGEAHIFGPIDALSIDPHLDTWPLNTVDLQAQLANNSGFDPEMIKTWNDDVQGFHTMEYLLFGDGVDNNQKSIEAMTSQEREYLVSLALVAMDYSSQLVQAWTLSYDGGESYAEALKEPGNNFYSANLAVVEELVNGLIGIVDEVGNGKIADPFGASLELADTSLVESQYSWNSLLDFSDNIIGVQTVYRGEGVGQSDQPGLDDWVRAADADLADRIDGEIQAAVDAILAIAGENDMPFRQAILDEAGRARVQSAVDALTTLQSSLESDLLPLLSEWNG
ncbi:imelysin family protein [Ferrimonas marina]|uniref:Predicted lipoprotein n=1 Tax=Ferrimonas marina TaxID=299255 RepID=A0A1M5RTN5_9GAMM|nr:imelysin family protein [Ferrimonas marina]SHH29667.1 Predicted lipoprotein [Ferrimonas marina]